MLNAVPASSADRPTSILEDSCAWEEIQRIAHSLARRVAAQPPTRQPAQGCPPRCAEHLKVGGTGYYVRSELQGQAPDPSVILIAIERYPIDLPSQQELRRAFGLTRRESRVAFLLADRKTNHEIAEELRVTEHTARRHTEKVLLKLGIHRRTEVRSSLTRGRALAEVANRSRDPWNLLHQLR